MLEGLSCCFRLKDRVEEVRLDSVLKVGLPEMNILICELPTSISVNITNQPCLDPLKSRVWAVVHFLESTDVVQTVLIDLINRRENQKLYMVLVLDLVISLE